MWQVGRQRGGAVALHSLDLLGRPGSVWRLDPERPAVVLGSTQPMSVLAAEGVARRGLEVCRRRSGGGLVVVDPSATVWVDVVLGRDDPRWDDDVDRSARWLGRLWAAALGEGAEVHGGPLTHRDWSRLVCFAGVGPGEVTLAGRKVVGISQRRDRRGARFQCVLNRRWDAARLGELVDPGSVPDGKRDELVEHLRVGVAAVPDADAVADRLVDALRLGSHH